MFSRLYLNTADNMDTTTQAVQTVTPIYTLNPLLLSINYLSAYKFIIDCPVANSTLT